MFTMSILFSTLTIKIVWKGIKTISRPKKLYRAWTAPPVLKFQDPPLMINVVNNIQIDAKNRFYSDAVSFELKYYISKYLCEIKKRLKMSFELKFWSNVFDDVRYKVWMVLSWISIVLGANLSSGKKTSLSVVCNNALFQAKFNELRYWSWSWRHFMQIADILLTGQ